MANENKKSLTYLQKYWISEVSAYLASVGVPVGTALALFPPEILQETKMSVGLSVIVVTIIALATFRQRMPKEIKANTVIAWVYTIGAIICLAVKYLVDQLTVIMIVGAIANWASAPLFDLASKNKEKNEMLKKARTEKEIKEQVEC